MIGEERVLSVLEDALHAATADETEIVVESLHQGVTRYAGSRIHQTTVLDDLKVRVRAAVGKSVGAVEGDSLAPDDVRALLAAAAEVARNGREDPNYAGLPDPQPVNPVSGYDPQTAEMSSNGRAAAIGEIVRQVAERGWTASGTYLTEGRELVVANSRGVRAYAPSSTAFLRALPDSGQGTGYADALSSSVQSIDATDVAIRAMEICERNHDQIEVPPGEYEAIFGDLCVAETLYYLARTGFNGRSFVEGTSFVSGRLGERVTGERVTIWDDATDRRNLTVAADYEGVPKGRLSLLTEGVANNVAHDTYTAHRVGEVSTGYAPDPFNGWAGPVPTNLFMAGGDASLEEMIAETERGLLLTRFHYTHCPDPKRVVMTGTTRDGTFLIENGEIVAAVRNLRLTQSVPDLYEGIEMLGAPRLCRDWWSSNGMGRLSYVCPPIKVRRALFSSGTLF